MGFEWTPWHTSGPRWGHLWLCMFPLLSTWLCCAPHCSHSMPPIWNQTPMDQHPAGAGALLVLRTFHLAPSDAGFFFLFFFFFNPLTGRHWSWPLCFIAGRILFYFIYFFDTLMGGQHRSVAPFEDSILMKAVVSNARWFSLQQQTDSTVQTERRGVWDREEGARDRTWMREGLSWREGVSAHRARGKKNRSGIL